MQQNQNNLCILFCRLVLFIAIYFYRKSVNRPTLLGADRFVILPHFAMYHLPCAYIWQSLRPVSALRGRIVYQDFLTVLGEIHAVLLNGLSDTTALLGNIPIFEVL